MAARDLGTPPRRLRGRRDTRKLTGASQTPPRGCEFEEEGEDVEDFLRQCGYCPWWERPAAPDTLQKDRDLLVELQQALRPINVVHGWNFWVPKVSTCDRRAGRSGGLTQKRSTAGPVRQRGRSPA